MKYKINTVLIVGLLCLGANVSLGQATRHPMIVIRYDASLITLTNGIVNALFTKERLDKARQDLGMDAKHRFNVQVGQEGGPQPPGVFVGNLLVERSFELSQDSESGKNKVDAKALEDRLIQLLQRGLSENLADSVEGLTEERKRIEIEIKELEDELSELTVVANDMASKGSMEERLEIVRQLEEQTRELQFNEKVASMQREFLNQMLSETNQKLKNASQEREQLQDETSHHQQQKSELMAELRREKESDRRKKMLAEIAKFELVQSKLEKTQLDLDRERDLISVKLAEMDKQLQDTTMEAMMLREKLQVNEDVMELERRRMKEAQGDDSNRQMLERKMLRVESSLHELNERLHDIDSMQRSLVPVRVRRWE